MTIHRDSDSHAALALTSPDTDFIGINRIIERGLHASLSECIKANKQHSKCVVILTTLGGDPHAGYRIARCLRHHYKEVCILIPSLCKSAGTLIAIGANELRIGDMGELGPLDIQVIKPAETIERGSGLDVTTALQQCATHAQRVFFSFFQGSRTNLRLSPRLAGEFASGVTAGLLTPLYSQIDPLRLGEMQRAMAITLEYGSRLNGHSSNLKPDGLGRLTMGYPAHEFVIDRKEAGELFQRVSSLSDNENLACMKLWSILGTPSESGLGPFFILPDEPSPEATNGLHTGSLSSGNASTKDAEPSFTGTTPAKAGRRRPRAGAKDQ